MSVYKLVNDRAGSGDVRTLKKIFCRKRGAEHVEISCC